MFDHRRRRKPRICSANLPRHFGMQRGHSLDVRFVDNQVLQRNFGLAIALPVVRRIDHHALGHGRRAVAEIETRHGAGGDRSITHHRVVPSRNTIERARVRIEHQLGRVEAMPRDRIVGTAHPKPITLTGPNAGYIYVPDVFGALGQRQSRDLLVAARAAEQAERRGSRVLGKYRKVHARPIAGGAQRIRHAGQSYKFGFRHFDRDTIGQRQC